MGVPSINLLGGYKMPMVGFGTAGKNEDGRLEVALNTALENGYRHIDTAYIYENEEEVGKVLQKWISSGKIQREELFIVTKLPPFANTPERVEEALKESLNRLQLDYVDQYLIHFPVWMEPKDPQSKSELIPHKTDLIALWKKMEEQVDARRTRTIGLSNFSQQQISKILKNARIKPAALQIEVHIYNQSDKLINYAQTNGLIVVAYSPLGAVGRIVYSEDSGLKSVLFEDPVVVKIAEKYHKTPCQVLLKFLLQRNIVVIPKSFTPSRIKENIDLFDFTLNELDLKALRGLEVGEKARIGFRNSMFDNICTHPEWPFKGKKDNYLAKPNATT
ncbi:hypothetical protein ABEB36_008136 [Hypothenemus hampei]|uniref:NADP-dependent oxidoreductase domain-containing protein n=1 Tax=Hypothenemus hampei TaxID=57062 RepID=A0ABD1EKV9_HYPHA